MEAGVGGDAGALLLHAHVVLVAHPVKLRTVGGPGHKLKSRQIYGKGGESNETLAFDSSLTLKVMRCLTPGYHVFHDSLKNDSKAQMKKKPNFH